MITAEQRFRDALQVRNAVERIQLVGPSRIVVSAGGNAVPPGDVLANHVEVDVVFIRKDGWCLGAPARFERVALRQWQADWIARYDPATGQVDRLNEVPPF